MSQNPVCRRVVTVNRRDGLHLRPLSQIAQWAQQCDCEIRIRKNDQTVDAKSMLELMTLEATCGTELELEGNGEGAAEAVDQLVRLFESDFEIDLPADS